MTDTQTGPFGEYNFAARMFWVKCTNLIVTRRWEHLTFSGLLEGPRFSVAIVGKAISEHDSVCVIGKEEQETKKFDLILKSNENCKEDWERMRSIRELKFKNDDNSPGFLLRAEIFKRLKENLPTAALLPPYDDYLERGYKDGWGIECAIPPSVFAQLDAELITERVHELYLGINWEAGLVKYKYLPPDVPTCWGLFTIADKCGPEPMNGHVTFVRWNVSDREAIFNQAAQEGSIKQLKIEEIVSGLDTTLTGHVAALTRTCIIGFVLSFVLILVCYFLR